MQIELESSRASSRAALPSQAWDSRRFELIAGPLREASPSAAEESPLPDLRSALRWIASRPGTLSFGQSICPAPSLSLRAFFLLPRPCRSSASRENESLATSKIEQHLDVGISAIYRRHLGHRACATSIDFQCEQSSSRETVRSALDELARYRQSFVSAE